MGRKRLEITLPDDNPIWETPKGRRAKLIHKALLFYFGKPPNQSEAEDEPKPWIRDLIEASKTIAEELRCIRLILESGKVPAHEVEQPAEEPAEEKPSVAEHLRKMIKDIWDTEEDAT